MTQNPLAETSGIVTPVMERDAVVSPRPNGAARMNVLHIMAPGEIGGAESVVRLLASTQRALGARVAVVAVVETKHAASDLLDALNRLTPSSRSSNRLPGSCRRVLDRADSSAAERNEHRW